MRPTVVLADDHAGILESVSRLLRPGFEIVAAVSNGQKAIEAVARYSPDIAILDISMPTLDGFQTAREMNRIWSKTIIVFLTVFDDEDYIFAALECGVTAYVLKRCIHSDLIHAIEQALAGQMFVSSWSADQIRSERLIESP